MAAHPQNDPFLQEVVELFAQEASEWLAQINEALLELEQGCPHERQPKQFEIILRGLTSLGGSAATVELNALEQVALALVPLLQALQRQAGGGSADRFAVVREGFQAITSMVQDITGAGAGSAVRLDQLLQRISDATVAHGCPAPALDQPPPPGPDEQKTAVPARSPSVMDALLNLQRRRPSSSGSSRHIIETVLRKVHAASGREAEAYYDLLPTVARVLGELKKLDEQFLAELEQRLPKLVQEFSCFKAGCADGQMSAETATRMGQEAHGLRDMADSIGAGDVMRFFAGLQGFLQVAARGRVVIVPQRFDVVEARLGDLMPIARQWIELGRVEIAEIEQLVCRR